MADYEAIYDNGESSMAADFQFALDEVLDFDFDGPVDLATKLRQRDASTKAIIDALVAALVEVRKGLIITSSWDKHSVEVIDAALALARGESGGE